MRAVEVYLHDKLGIRLPLTVTSLVVDEKANKSSVYEVSGWSTLDLAADTSMWRGSTVQVKAGVTPWLTTRACVIDGPPKKDRDKGRIFWNLKLKCLSGRMARTTEDKVWTQKTLPEIITFIALTYGLVTKMQGAGPALAVRKTIHQRMDDWAFLLDLGEKLDSDVFVVHRTLYVRQRSLSNVERPVRTYVWNSDPFRFVEEGAQSGRIGASATNRERLTQQETIAHARITNDSVHPEPALATQSFFNPYDMDGVSIAPLLSDPITIASYVGKTGQWDSGAGEMSTEQSPVLAGSQAKSQRRRGRDYVTKASLEYDEWDDRGTPMVGTKIMVGGMDKPANGEYFVRARVLTMMPKVGVRLVLARHSTHYVAPLKLTAEQISQGADRVMLGIEGSQSKVPQPPDVAAIEGLGLGMDFATGTV